MSKGVRGCFVLGLRHDDQTSPLYAQIYHFLRSEILEGRIASGQRLPSTRTLATELGVSRTTAEEAYGKLFEEGFITRGVGSGTFAAQLEIVERAAAETHIVRVPAPRMLGVRAKAMRKHACYPEPTVPKAFMAGTPDVSEFPLRIWRTLIARSLREASHDMLGTSDARGTVELRTAIASYVGALRGVNCNPERIVVCASAQQAVDLCARILVDPGDKVWVEDPGYPGARAAFEVNGAHIVGIPVDDEGLDVAEGIRRARDAKVAYVTPSHQFPMGVVLSLERRLALLDWASSHGAWIIEDDYDSEFRYERRSIAAIQGIDHEQRVLYLGTFSKVMFPSLRLAYIVAPEDLVEPLSIARGLSDGHPPLSTQFAMAQFMSEGHFAAHIRRMREIYRARRDALVQTFDEKLSGVLKLGNADAGLHTVALGHGHIDDQALSDRLALAGVWAHPLSRYFAEKPTITGLFLGYAGIQSEQITNAVHTIANVLGDQTRAVKPIE